MLKYCLLIFTCLLIFLCACNMDDENNDKIDIQSKQLLRITYNLVCADCEVIYVSGSLGNQAIEYNQNNNWSYSFWGKKNQEMLILL